MPPLFARFQLFSRAPKMGLLGRAARSRVIYGISRVGATRWRQWVGAVALYYPIPSECNKPHATSATMPGETAMVKRLLGALRTGPSEFWTRLGSTSESRIFPKFTDHTPKIPKFDHPQVEIPPKYAGLHLARNTRNVREPVTVSPRTSY